MNKVILIGRTTAVPEISYLQNGNALAKFSLAIDDGYGENKKTNYINCVAFAKTAEVIANYVVKGQQIGIEGKISTGSYVAKDGTKRYTTDIIVDRLELLGKPNRERNDEAQPSIKYTEDDPQFSLIDEDIPF